MNSTSDVNTNGVADLFVGAKFQLMGERAPVQTSMFRAAIAPGVIIPLPSPKFADQVENLVNNRKATVQNMDNHALGVGGRVYFDWIINEYFFLNLYNETLFYPVKQDLDKAGINLSALKGQFANTPFASVANNVSGEVNYKYRLTFEIEPVFTTSLAEGISFSAGLPVNYRYIPAYDYSIKGLEELAALPIGTTASELRARVILTGTHEAQQILTLKPNVSVFITKTPLPLEFKLTYSLPIWGKNVPVRHDVTLQTRVYFALPNRPQ